MSSPSSPSPDLDSERLHYLRSPICTIKPSFPWGQTPRKGERWFYAQRQDVSFSRKVAVHSCPPPPAPTSWTIVCRRGAPGGTSRVGQCIHNVTKSE